MLARTWEWMEQLPNRALPMQQEKAEIRKTLVEMKGGLRQTVTVSTGTGERVQQRTDTCQPSRKPLNIMAKMRALGLF